MKRIVLGILVLVAVSSFMSILAYSQIVSNQVLTEEEYIPVLNKMVPEGFTFISAEALLRNPKYLIVNLIVLEEGNHRGEVFACVKEQSVFCFPYAWSPPEWRK